jgi:hypothetical protein
LSDEFLHLPDRLAGYPLSLGEGVELIMKAAYGESFRLKLSIEETISRQKEVWRGLLFQLALNELHSFAQANNSGSWFRIPSDYWKDWAKLSPVTTSPPSVLRDVLQLGWVPEGLIGAPIVVWRDSIAGMTTRQPLARPKKHTEDTVTCQAPPPVSRRKPGRPPSYDWPTALAALLEWADRDDVIAAVLAGEGYQQADLEKWMSDWFAGREQFPSPAIVRSQVAGVIQSRREANAAKANNRPS